MNAKREYFLRVVRPPSIDQPGGTGATSFGQGQSDQPAMANEPLAWDCIESARTCLSAWIDAIPTPVLVKDDKHTFVAVNQAFTEFFRRPAEQLIGKTDWDFFNPEDARFYQDTDDEALQNGAVVEYERAYSLESGTRWMLVRKSPLITPDGTRFLVLAMTDVTERRATERALRESEARFRRLTDLSADWYWEQDAELRLTSYSRPVTPDVDHPPAALLGLRRWEHPGVNRDSADWDSHKALCQARQPFHDFTYSRLDKDGRERWLLVSGEPVFDEKGSFIGYQGVGRDVTAEKRIAQEVERSKNLYAALSQTNRAIIHIRDPQALFDEVCRVAVQFGQFRLVWIGLLDEESGWVKSVAMEGPARAGYPHVRVSIDPSIPEGRGYASAVLREDRGYVVNDYFSDSRITAWADLARATGVKSLVALPLRRSGRCVGVLNFYGGEVGFFTDPLVGLLQEMAENLSFALTNIDRLREQAATQRALQESEQRFRQLAGNLPQVVWIAEPGGGRVVYASPAYEQVWGRKVSKLLEDPCDWRNAIHPADRARVEHTFRTSPPGSWDDTYRIVQPDGSVRWIHDRSFPIFDQGGKVTLVTGVAEDITARKESEEKLLFLAHHDSLTRLPNRVLLYEQLEQHLARARRDQTSVAVIFLDLDHFKRINDTLGHAAGDRLLQDVSLRLKGAVRGSDTVGRLSGDEFAVILADMTSNADAETACRKVMQLLHQPFVLEGKEFFVTASAGIAMFPADAQDPETLIKHADTAMYRAKELGRTNCQFYESNIHDSLSDRVSLENQLVRALERREFILHYQPKVSFATGRITSVEALLRWNSPLSGLVPPGDFIPLLEENGFIVEVGNWVLGEVCRQIKAWDIQGIHVSVAVNLSGRQLEYKDLERSIHQALTEGSIDPCRIEFELTESMLMRNPEQAARVLQHLKTLGIRLSVDDFGTGYSSLSYLTSFPLDTLKIDRSFVHHMVKNKSHAAIVQAIIALARTLNFRTVAEGIEDKTQFDLLHKLGCDEYQGYYFSKPVPADAIGGLLQQAQVATAA